MGVVSTKELPQTFEREVGRPAIIKRRVVCVLSDNTLENAPATELQILAAVFGLSEQTIANSTIFGAAHPRFAAWKLRRLLINEGFEGSPYHVEVVLEYGIVRDEELLSPGARPTKFSVDGGLGEYPALFFYDGGTTYPLTNSAYDFYPGLMTMEGLLKITISKNFEIVTGPGVPANLTFFPGAWRASLNHVNSDTYWGCAPGTLKIEDFDATEEYEEWGNGVVKYWKATATLAYRQSGHSLQLPDVGYNFLSGNQKRRAMVFDFDNSEWVPSPSPVALNGSGGLSSGAPATLVRRVNPEADFQTVFGTPPT